MAHIQKLIHYLLYLNNTFEFHKTYFPDKLLFLKILNKLDVADLLVII